MTIGLNVLNHLGINLYSNVPAVLSEAVANAWDADAEHVWIDIDTEKARVTIRDDGQGMRRDEVNTRYLNVGHRRREEVPPDEGGAITKKFDREVMGRKGIGKLSLFSVAEVIEVHTLRNGERSAFRMRVADIRKAIAKDPNVPYKPVPLPESVVDIDRGTRIILTEPKKALHQTALALRRRIARRFGVLGAEYHFEVIIDGEVVTIEDRDYFHKVEHLWWYGPESESYVALADRAKGTHQRDAHIGGDLKVRGWIGTAHDSGHLKDEYDNLNKIVVMIRGKLAQEDILDEFNEGGLYTKYLIGEIHADFLDRDDLPDIATSSRQRLIEDDPRYEALKVFLQRELKNIENTWTQLRDTEGTSKALELAPIKEWFTTLGPDSRKKARSLFGRVNRMTISDKEKVSLFKYCILAFENLRYKDTLDKLEDITEDNLTALATIFSDLDDIEATLYHQMLSERVRVIDKLRDAVDENALERVVQQHVYEHLWLLDPAWERATAPPMIEAGVKKEFKRLDAKLSEDEAAARLDIRYRKTSGENVIIELKRGARVVSTGEVLTQGQKYRSALRKVLDAAERAHEPIEVVVLVGRPLSDWDDPDAKKRSEESLRPYGIRVLQYQKLLDDAYASYKGYLEKRDDVGRLAKIIQQLDAYDLFDQSG